MNERIVLEAIPSPQIRDGPPTDQRNERRASLAPLGKAALECLADRFQARRHYPVNHPPNLPRAGSAGSECLEPDRCEQREGVRVP